MLKGNQMLGIFLKKNREKLNISQTELAKILNIPPSYISQFELDERVPNIKLLLQMVSVLKINLKKTLFLAKETKLKRIKKRIERNYNS